MRSFHVVIPMSGQGTRYRTAGYVEPKPLIPVNGTPMIERLLDSMPERWNFHFIMAENHRDSGLAEFLRKKRPGAKINFIGPHKEGPSYALRSFLQDIPATDPVLVSYCDYGLVWDPNHFEKFVTDSNCDACLVSYRGFHAHYLNPQNYAFSRLVGEKVVEVREKANFTDDREKEYASCGAYYFRSREVLESAIDFQIHQQMSLNGEYYTSLTVQALLLQNPSAHVRVYEIPAFYQWGTPQDLQEFEYWERTYSKWNRSVVALETLPRIEQILMPMAGFGSRFQSLTSVAKPLIQIEGVPMFVKALKTFPDAEKCVFVTRQEIAKAASGLMPSSHFVALDYVPEGQALTTQLGLEVLEEGKEILVTACDHGVVIDPDKWKAFKSVSTDAAIFVIKGFPGVRRKPTAYSYVQADPDGLFPRFKGVSTKAPMTENPLKEMLLVGSFWFRNSKILNDGIEALKKKNLRVNNEIYLDSVFNELRDMGLDIKVFELDGYINWGDPDSLKEALYWQEVFLGRQLAPRSAFPGVHFEK